MLVGQAMVVVACPEGLVEVFGYRSWSTVKDLHCDSTSP